MKAQHNCYTLTDDKSYIQLDRVCDLLSRSYWANKRPKETIEKSIKHSICVIVLHEKQQVGFARVVTDHATFSWVADVIVDEKHRGAGIGKAIMQFIQDHPDIPDYIQLLATDDAHKLYEKYGYKADQCMIKRSQA